MKKAKITVIVVLVLVVVMGVSSFVKNRRLARERLSIKDMPDKVEQKILTFELANYAEDGSKKWKLKGSCADILAEIVNLQNIDMETYNEPRITVSALKGTYDKMNKEISLFDDVEVLTSDGALLTTDYLKWNEKTDTITTDKPVRIVRSDVIADGKGALAMPQMKKIILNRDVKVVLATNVIKDINIAPKKDLAEKKTRAAIITCKGPLDIDYENNIAIFNEDVLVDDKKGKIYSERMEAFLDPVTKNIIKVVAEGDVKVVRGEDSTYSQKAIYTTEDQKIILIGRPKIYIHSTEEMEKTEKELEGL